MALSLPVAIVLAALLGAGPAMAQQPGAPATPVKPAPAQPTQPKPTSPKPTSPKPTSPKPGQPPVIQPKPGTAAKHPSRPPAKPTHPIPALPTAPPAPAVPEPNKPIEPSKGSNSGNPLPRFVTLRSDEVNLRTGPGTRYPIDWVYKRRDLPVMIEREFEVWRLVRDSEGVKGWVHQATLAPRRSGVVTGGEQVLRHDPRDDSAPVAKLKPGVVVRLRSCEAASDWCQAQIQDYRGWLKRTEIWGTFPGEAIQ